MDLLGLFVVWLVVAITAAIVASNKGRSGVGWFFLCMLLTPVAILILLALPRRGAAALAAADAALDPAETKVCPRCAETVRRAAAICRFCGYTFAAPASEPST